MLIRNKRILFLNWKDILHPSSGGAEVLTDALASHLALSNDVVYITSSFAGAKSEQLHNNYTILRTGNSMTCIIYAYFLFKKLYKKQKFDLIIDQVHGVPFFSIFYPRHPKIITLIYEIADELWSSIIPEFLGKLIDIIWLWLYKNQKFITISNSTKHELMRNHIPEFNIDIIPVFTDIVLNEIPVKSETPTLIVLGRIAPVKRIEHAVQAFHIIKKSIPNCKLVIIGKTEQRYTAYYEYIKKITQDDQTIRIIIRASNQEKLHWLKKSHILLMPSKKEGYGIAILEANACGTPAIGYDVPGIRDAILHNKTGLLAHRGTPEALASCAHNILSNPEKFTQMQHTARNHAKQQNMRNTISAWDNVIDNII